MTTFAVLLPLALGLALSPVPVIEMILVLLSKRRVANSVAFVIALAMLSAIGLAFGAAGSQAASDDADGTSPAMAVVLALLGVALLGIGAANYRNRRDASEPPILSKVSDMGPGAVAFLALGATLLNPKNLPLLLAAGSALADTSTPVLAGGLFLIVCTSPYWAAAIYTAVGGPAAQQRLDALREWLVQRNRLIMGVLCIALGIVLLGKGASALLG